ncbi:MAG: DinB family protein [Bacteroidota bacterium]
MTIPTNEYAPFYAPYIEKVPTGNLLEVYQASATENRDFYATVSPEKQNYAYAPGKWTIAEVLQHVIDMERIFAARLLRVGRGDQTPLPGVDQNDYAEAASFELRPYDGLVEEYFLLKQSNLAMAKGFPSNAWARMGNASGNDVSARALFAMLVGHEQHHLRIIRERYFSTSKGA